jgi:hypothetical protein
VAGLSEGMRIVNVLDLRASRVPCILPVASIHTCSNSQVHLQLVNSRHEVKEIQPMHCYRHAI